MRNNIARFDSHVEMYPLASRVNWAKTDTTLWKVYSKGSILEYVEVHCFTLL